MFYYPLSSVSKLSFLNNIKYIICTINMRLFIKQASRSQRTANIYLPNKSSSFQPCRFEFCMYARDRWYTQIFHLQGYHMFTFYYLLAHYLSFSCLHDPSCAMRPASSRIWERTYRHWRTSVFVAQILLPDPENLWRLDQRLTLSLN